MTDDNDKAHMRAAIAASREAKAAGDMPYGAALAAPDGTLLHVSRNRQKTSGDCTAHAEVVLIREAAARLGAKALAGATVYASGEPCAMCAGALHWAGVARVVFGVRNDTIMRVGGPPTMAIPCARVFAAGSNVVVVDGPLLEDEAVAVIAGQG